MANDYTPKPDSEEFFKTFLKKKKPDTKVDTKITEEYEKELEEIEKRWNKYA